MKATCPKCSVSYWAKRGRVRHFDPPYRIMSMVMTYCPNCGTLHVSFCQTIEELALVLSSNSFKWEPVRAKPAESVFTLFQTQMGYRPRAPHNLSESEEMILRREAFILADDQELERQLLGLGDMTEDLAEVVDLPSFLVKCPRGLRPPHEAA